METNNTSNIEQAIRHFTQGKSTSMDEKLLSEWINESPENRKLLFREKDLWDASQIGSPRLREIEFEQWEELQNRLSARKQKTFSLAKVFRVAAMVIFAIGTGWMGHYFYTSTLFSGQQTEQKTVEAIKGQIKEVFLADGTHVWLNSHSSLSFPSGFSKNKREVTLQGEAFFEVTANEKTPFFVKTKNHTIKVVGTKFNVCEYPESNIIETTLVEGRVKIITGNLITDLMPGQQASFSSETAKVRISEKDFEIYTAWKDGRYEFKNEPVEKIFLIIERWWDVRIIYPEKEFKNERISGVIKRHKPVDQLFGLIGQLLPINYTIEKDEIVIKTNY
jgi:ferric-dicitrate binding protein FerR (iron transport regulator)